MVSPGSTFWPIAPEYPWNKKRTDEQILKIEDAAFAAWNNEDLLDDLNCDIADLDSQKLEEEVLVEENLDDFEAFQSEVPHKINSSRKATPKATPELTQLTTMVEYLELITEQNHEMLKFIKTLTTRLDTLEHRLIHALWDPEKAVEEMFIRRGKVGRPKTSCEKREDGARPAAAHQTPKQTPKQPPKQQTEPVGKSELEIQQNALMQYQQYKQLMNEKADREMIERTLVESQHVYTRLGMPNVSHVGVKGSTVPSSQNTSVSIAGFFDSPIPESKKGTGFGEPGKYT